MITLIVPNNLKSITDNAYISSVLSKISVEVDILLLV